MMSTTNNAQICPAHPHLVGGPGLLQARPTINIAKSGIQCASWNVRTILPCGNEGLLARSLAERSITVACLSELRLEQNGSKLINIPTPDGAVFAASHYKLFYSGPDVRTGQAGVGFAILGSYADHVLEWKPISDRLAYLRVDTKPVATSIISCYAPTEQAVVSVKNDFWDALNLVMHTVPKSDLIVVAGDFNSQVGRRNVGEESVLGHNCLGRRSDNGDRFVTFLCQHSLSAINTSFRHKRRHLETWKSADNVTRNQIDYICVNDRWRSSAISCRSFWGNKLKV